LEPLESRTLLSVSLENGTLSIVGTSAADSICIRPAKSPGSIKVRINGEVSFFNKADITGIHVDAGAGNDTVLISEIGATIEIPATILGGAGNDGLQGGGGNDLIQGGEGNDSLMGGRGDDVVEGGAGNDTLIASAGKDSLDGGDGDDQIVGDGYAEDDSIIASAGNDKVNKGTRPNFPIQTFTDVPSGYSVRQMRAAYGFGDLDDPSFTNRGKGQTIVIIDAFHAPRARQDLIEFARNQNTLPGVKNLNKYFASHFHQVWTGTEGPKFVDEGWNGEALLDIQWAHAIAPEAKIVLVEAQSTVGGDLIAAVATAAKILGKTRSHGGVVSMSFDLNTTAADQVAFETAFKNVGNDRISFVVAAGDTGGVTSGLPTGPPSVTVVGGTKLYLDPFGNRVTGYLNEAPTVPVNGGLTPPPPIIDNWNHDINCFPPADINDDSGATNQTGISGGEGAWWNGGGGPSDIFDAPLYQQNRVGNGINFPLFDTNNDGIPDRGTPDVAYNADPATGVPVFNSFGAGGQSGWETVGGTSAGAPQFAALVTLANQLRAISHKAPIGNTLNERIYRLGGRGPDKYFNDIDVHGSGLLSFQNACNGQGRGRDPNAFVFPAVPGWDYATGWGSPNARTLVPALADQKLKFTSRRTVKFTGRISQRVFQTVNGQPAGSTLDFLTFIGNSTITGYNTLTMPSFRMHFVTRAGGGPLGGGGGANTTVTANVDVIGMDPIDGQPNVPAYSPRFIDFQTGVGELLAPGSPINFSRNGNSLTGHGFYLITIGTTTTGGVGGGTTTNQYFYFSLQFRGTINKGKISGQFFTNDSDGTGRQTGAFNDIGLPVVSGKFES
jgi:Ca2+-binding RTX toxin-like protein